MDESAALFVTSWKNNSYSPANWKLITDICENTLKKKSKLSTIHCTVLDVELSEEQREDATRYGVTLIPSTRPKWSKPDEDPPVINWLLNHYNYYPGLAKLQDITHVVGMYAKTHNAASAIHESLFQKANLHLVPSKPAALFVGDSWNEDEFGLTGFHRTLVQDFCERKAKAGEDLKAYSTVLDVKISDDQNKDAESCGVTLIPAQRKEKADHRDDPPKLEWLLNHEIYYPDLQKLENVQYVVGYAPKTGRAAADIRRKLFPGAKLVFINHACPERNYLQAEEYSLSEFEEKMLQMASEADILFSIGPYIFDYFQNAYRAEFEGRDLSDIPHEEILPKPNRCFFVKDPKLRPVTRHHILTYGQMDTQMAIEGCKSIAASIGTAANHRKAHCSSHPDWKIQGVCKKAGRTERKILADASKSPYVYPKLQPGHSAKSLLTSLQQSHLCLPSPCYWDYSFHGLEAMAFGLPTSVDEDSHLGHFVIKHLEMHIDYCVVSTGKGKLSEKISQHLQETPLAFKKAKALKTALTKCEAITENFAKFASLFKGPIKKETEDDADVSYNGKSSMQSTKQVPESLNGTMSTLAVTADDSIGSQGIEETHGDVKDEEDTESGQVKTTPPEKENEKPNTKEAKVGNCNKEHQDFQVKVALDEEMLQKRLRQSEEQTQAVSVQPQQNGHEVKTAWRECEQGLKRRVQAVLADEDSCNEVKKVCKEKVGLDPNTLTAESLGILLKILTLYYLYRVKQTCRSRNLAKALEPLLITDEMRKIADTVGITLQLKAMYDMAKFEEIELFFINRDGGGVQPVTFHDDTEDNGGHCNFDSEGEKPSLSQQESDPIVEPSQTNLEQSLEETLTQHGDPTLSITAAYSSLSLQARSLLPIKQSKYQLTDSDIRYLALAKSKVQSLQSQLDKAFTDKSILEGRLTDALNEKSQFKMQYDKYLQKYQNAEKVVSTQLSEINTLTAQLKQKDNVITGLRTQLEQVSGAQSDIELLKKLAEERQLGETIVISEMDDIGKRDSSGIFGKFFKRLTGRKDKTDGSKVMSIGKKELSGSVTAGSKELFSSSGPVLSVMSGGTSTWPGSKEEQSGSYSDGSGKGSDSESMERMVGGGALSSTEALCGSDVDRDDETSNSESMEEMVGGRATTSSAGHWSRRTLKGHQRQMFQSVRGLAFHNDKLLVCDRDNNIVHILNQDYTCEKQLGSFGGHFAKPFKPWTIAVSQDNLYFILDYSNVQIVVCDQSNKVIRIITLPTDSSPLCIALVKGFVIVTDIKGHRVLKYSQDGHYISEFGGGGNHQTRFNWPGFVAVNSGDVIMVSDNENHCIKCFDTDLNYLYKYSHRGKGDGALCSPYSIAVDSADHVYVCDHGNARISMWSGDGTWRCHLFQGEVSYPWFMAVTADGDRIAVRGWKNDEIIVFSK
ncbi:uncharacterized protein [Ptychodera flava]|uniref:uncharacterized protein isoform X4 n=1 Tax=Ptychodera flava TaxID=63121 RepID=UPI003969D274